MVGIMVVQAEKSEIHITPRANELIRKKGGRVTLYVGYSPGIDGCCARVATPAVHLGEPEQDVFSYHKIEVSQVTVWKSQGLEPEQEGGTITIDVCKFLCFQNLKIIGAKPRPEIRPDRGTPLTY